MRYIKLIDVDDDFVSSLWTKVENAGSFYSIGDGYSKEHLRNVLYASNFVLSCPEGIIRFEIHSDFVEAHTMIFGHSAFSYLSDIASDIEELKASFFPDKPLCCIIPAKMKSFLRLVKAIGFAPESTFLRLLSGRPITCIKFIWRKTNV
jgi:hypothetical protein